MLNIRYKQAQGNIHWQEICDFICCSFSVQNEVHMHLQLFLVRQMFVCRKETSFLEQTYD